MVEAQLSLIERSTGRTLPCVVVGFSLDDRATLRLSSPQFEEVIAEGYDFEEALQVMRHQLDEQGCLLLCNRFRRDALVTSLSRQMSGGLSCYLVEPRTALDPEKLIECLGPADGSTVVTGAEADMFLEKWKSWFEKPALVRWARRPLG